MKQKPTYEIKIYLSGPIEIAKQIIREECKREGLCVTISQKTFIYTGGEEDGYVVSMLNYPRYPCAPEILLKRAVRIGNLLRDRTFQHSFLIVTPSDTYWHSDRQSR